MSRLPRTILSFDKVMQADRRWFRETGRYYRMREMTEPEYDAFERSGISFPPDIINGQCAWWLSVVQQYERTTQAGGTAPDRSQYLTPNKANTEAATS
jgi:hypothetical protein